VHSSKISSFLAERPGGVEEHENHFGICADEWLEEGWRGSGEEEIWITQASVELDCYKMSVTQTEQNVPKI